MALPHQQLAIPGRLFKKTPGVERSREESRRDLPLTKPGDLVVFDTGAIKPGLMVAYAFMPRALAI